MSELLPCPECQRHVRKTEASCPFCGEALSLAHLPPAVLPTRRLGRAATFAFGASVVGATALVGCSDGDDSGGGQAVYGAPAAGIGGMNVGGAPNGGNLNQGGSAQPVYGAPAAGTGNAPSAGAGGDSLSAVYGAPPGGGGAAGAGGAPGDAPCKTGAAACVCYANQTCDGELLCFAGLCVDLDGLGGAGGAGGAQ